MASVQIDGFRRFDNMNELGRFALTMKLGANFSTSEGTAFPSYCQSLRG